MWVPLATSSHRRPRLNFPPARFKRGPFNVLFVVPKDSLSRDAVSQTSLWYPFHVPISLLEYLPWDASIVVLRCPLDGFLYDDLLSSCPWCPSAFQANLAFRPFTFLLPFLPFSDWWLDLDLVRLVFGVMAMSWQKNKKWARQRRFLNLSQLFSWASDTSKTSYKCASSFHFLKDGFIWC